MEKSATNNSGGENLKRQYENKHTDEVIKYFFFIFTIYWITKIFLVIFSL